MEFNKIASKLIKFRERWVRSTDTPLRFFVQLLFIIELALITIIILEILYKLDNVILILTISAFIFLALVTIVLVFILVAYFPKNLVFDRKAYLFESALIFGDESHIMAYRQLLQSDSSLAPPQIAQGNNKKDGKNE